MKLHKHKTAMLQARTILSYLVLGAIWAALLWFQHQWATVGFLIASTLAYVGFVGIALWAEDNFDWFTSRWGAEEGFRRFRQPTAIIMNNYGISLVILAVVTRGSMAGSSMPWSIDDWAYWAVGGALIVAGYGIKHWARNMIGEGYYWIDFFAPPEDVEHSAEGPYRWFSNPMYTVGYAHAYGFAIVMQSLHALLAAAFMQLSILAFWWIVERAHYRKVYASELELQQEPTA